MRLSSIGHSSPPVKHANFSFSVRAPTAEALSFCDIVFIISRFSSIVISVIKLACGAKYLSESVQCISSNLMRNRESSRTIEVGSVECGVWRLVAAVLSVAGGDCSVECN